MSSAAGCPRGVNVVGVGGTTRDSKQQQQQHVALRRQATVFVHGAMQAEASDQNTIADTLSHPNSLRVTPTTPTSRPGLDHHPVKFTPHPRRVEQGTLLSPSQLCVQAWTAGAILWRWPWPACAASLSAALHTGDHQPAHSDAASLHPPAETFSTPRWRSAGRNRTLTIEDVM